MDNRNPNSNGYRGVERRIAATAATSLAPAVPMAMNSSERHAAIRAKLPTLATYKSWSAKARNDWEGKE
jgi:hypothetical protein